MAIIQTVVAGGGTTPTGTKNITTNGTHDVTNYASADVAVPTTAPAKYLEKNTLSYSSRTWLFGNEVTNVVDLTGITALPPYALAGAYSLCAPDHILDDSISYMLSISDPHPFNNIDLDFSYISSMGTGCLQAAFTGRQGINSVTATSTVGWNNAFAVSDVKEVIFKGAAAAGAANTFSYCGSLKKVTIEGTFGFNSGAHSFFSGCTNLETIPLDTVPYIGWSNSSVCAQTFLSGCTKITTLDLSNCTTIMGGTNSAGGSCKQFCNGCSGLVSINLNKLETIGDASNNTNVNGVCYAMFAYCTSLPTVRYPSLKAAGRYAMCGCFYGCTSLQSLWFYALTPTSFGSYSNQFSAMLSGVTGCTVHFPMAIQATIGSWSQVTAGFSGTNTTVLFDLVTSLTGADAVTYTRQEKDSTATATAWNDGNDVLFYTSGVSDNTNGVNEPAVGDTIYSDAACTTAVTTISSIA